jgi:hypothetical protein
MKPNDYIITTANHSNNRRLLTSSSPEIFAKEVVRTGFPTLTLGVAVLLTSSCTSSNGGFNARVITPVASGKQADAMTSDTFQSARSPGFDEYLGRLISLDGKIQV